MAKKKKPKDGGAAAMQLTDDEDTEPVPCLSLEAAECVSATLYTVREAVLKTAFKRAKGKFPVSLSTMTVALLENDLGWALTTTDKKADEKHAGNTPS